MIFCLTLIGVFAVTILPLHDPYIPASSNEAITNISGSIRFSVALNLPVVHVNMSGVPRHGHVTTMHKLLTWIVVM